MDSDDNSYRCLIRASGTSNPIWKKINPGTKGAYEFESVFKALSK